jgi:hypothetical protein
MKRVVPILLVLLLPSLLFAQATVKVSSIYGPVEWKAKASAKYASVSASSQEVQVGDEIRTGPGGTVMLELPDGSYMVVAENTTLTIQQYGNSSLNNFINLMLGKVRFYIQKFGGKPNPYQVGTPTALIAVRGTTFEVNVDDASFTEVRVFEGRVAVESVGLPDREVILEPGRKTLVRPGEYPLMPVNNDEVLLRNRVLKVVRKDTPADDPAAAMPSLDVVARDNDRINRPSDPLPSSPSGTKNETQRGKPTLEYKR